LIVPPLRTQNEIAKKHKRYIIEIILKSCYNLIVIVKRKYGEMQMKLFKLGTIMQIIHCVCCLITIVFMPIYTAFYTTAFGVFCFKTGALLTFTSTIIPIGLIGTIMNYVGCFTTNLKESKKNLIWIFISPVLVITLRLLSIYFFVHHSGGV
jgi:hypothetical protein